MTNFNRTFGNFAAGESEDFMVLNRNYERGTNNGIANGSTYINPQEHIDIFADTAIDSQNFWVQTACEMFLAMYAHRCTKVGANRYTYESVDKLKSELAIRVTQKLQTQT